MKEGRHMYVSPENGIDTISIAITSITEYTLTLIRIIDIKNHTGKHVVSVQPLTNFATGLIPVVIYILLG